MRVVCAITLLLMAVSSPMQAQDSLGMQRVGVLGYWQGANDIQMVADTAYVVSGASGLHIMNLSDPSHPVEIGRCTWYDLDDVTGGVYVTGTRAYVATGLGGLVFDISDPANPARLGYWSGENLSDIFVQGDLGIVSSVECCPVVADVSDPANVHVIGWFEGSSAPMKPVGMVGDYLCATGHSGGLALYDMSDPVHPQRVAVVDTLLDASGAALAGDFAYVSTYGAGLRIIDVSTPRQPVEVAACDSGWCLDVSVSGGHAVLLKPHGLDVWNVVDPAHPLLDGSWASPAEVTMLSSSGSLACIGTYNGDMAAIVVDISDPSTPMSVSSFGRAGGFWGMAVRDTLGYFLGIEEGFSVIGMADPAHLSLLGTCHAHGIGISLHGDYAYITGTPHGLCVFDIADAMHPESLWCQPGALPFPPDRIVIGGDYAYANYDGYLYVISLQNPASPAIVDSVVLDVELLAIRNSYLYGVHHYGIFDGAYLYVLSLANPAVPQLEGSCQFSQSFEALTKDLEVMGSYAYIADAGGGLRIIDVADPVNPTEVRQIGGNYFRLASSGHTLFADLGTRIVVLDVTDPIQPVATGYYDTAEWLRGMQVGGPYLYTISTSELRVYQVDALSDASWHAEVSPREFALHPCYPNPFNPSTVIRFSLPRTGYAKLTVYDIAGRQVKVLTDGVLSAGEHRVTFDGSALASGVYFARLEAEKNVRTEKLMLLK